MQAAVLLATASIALGQTASFTGLTPLSGDTTTQAYAVSRDGKVVAGTSTDGATPKGFYYGVETALTTTIGQPPGWFNASAQGIDRDIDGNVYVTGQGMNDTGQDKAFLYDDSTTPATFYEIPFLIGGNTNVGRAVRWYNGDVFVTGQSERNTGSSTKPHAFRWRRSSPGGSLDLGDTETDGSGDGNKGDGYGIGVRPDGSMVIRGPSESEWLAGHTPVGFTWDSGESFNYCLWWADLRSNPSPVTANARGTSADGRYVVGNSTFEESFCSSNRQAYLYDTKDADLKNAPCYNPGSYKGIQYCVAPRIENPSCDWGSRMLGYVPGHEGFSEGWGVSEDGSVVVGLARKLDPVPAGSCTWGEDETIAFIWDPQNGMRDLKLVLEGFGLDLTGWVLNSARSISADGSVICGTGKYNGVERGWVATIANPGSMGACCRQDATCEYVSQPECQGEFDTFHYGEACEEVICCHYPFSDGDGDGDVDMNDFAAFQACMNIGDPTVILPGCECWDENGDGLIDDHDFSRGFLICGTGSEVQADPYCPPAQ